MYTRCAMSRAWRIALAFLVCAVLPATAAGYHASLRIPDDFTGYGRGFWAAANGSAKVTELTY